MTAIRSPNSMPRISSGRLPASIAGLMTSVSQNADSVSAIRRRASPWTRSSRRVEAWLNPAFTWMAMSSA